MDCQRLFQAMCVPLFVLWVKRGFSRGLVVLVGRRAVVFLCEYFLFGPRLTFGLPAFVPRFGRPIVLGLR